MKPAITLFIYAVQIFHGVLTILALKNKDQHVPKEKEKENL